jgi:hypothetical protein
MSSRVEHYPQLSLVALSRLVGSYAATGGYDVGHRCVQVTDRHLEMDHFRLEALLLWPRRGLVPLLGLEAEADAAAMLGDDPRMFHHLRRSL